MTDHATVIRRSLAGTGEFDRRVREGADRFVDAFDRGEFDNEAGTLGLELELYAVSTDGERPHLARIPDAVFDGPADKELGLHNAELNTAPSRFDGAGIEAQAERIAADLAETRERVREYDREIVLDAMPAVPPAEGTYAYFDDVTIDRGDASDGSEGDGHADGTTPTDDGVVVPGGDPEDQVIVARNMRRDPRYGALDNEAVRRAGGAIQFDVPGVTHSFRTILFESLTTSIQPHVQVPDLAAFPQHHNLAVRTLGPLLALSTNSPFLPGDCYESASGIDAPGSTADGIDDPASLVDRTHHELRIAAFEQSMNQRCRKVGVPDDLDDPTDAVEHVVADDTFAPFLREWVEDDGDDGAADADEGDNGNALWEFDYKRSTFWRWVRGVPGGAPVDGACDEQSLRIEYRPLPTQPTVRDIVGLQVLTAGLLRGLVAGDHPLCDLPWEAAERSFYAAVEDGLDADLAWVTADGERTRDASAIYEEVFAYARRGLDEQGVSEDVQERYLGPLEARWEQRVTPSIWKKRQVRGRLDDGLDLVDALAAMQREYVELCRECETFVEWVS